MKTLKIAIAQLNFTVGALEANKKKILRAYQKAAKNNADLVIFSELCVCGYPPEDLVMRPKFQQACMKMVEDITQATKDSNTAMIIGSPWVDKKNLFNSAFLIERGQIKAISHKHDLPNYGVFDEKRVFNMGPLPTPIEWRGVKLGLMICEDMWNTDLTEPLRGSEILISINASPFELGKHAKRLERASIQSRALGLPLIYVNQCCGQDDLVFDGDSFVLSKSQEMITRLSRSEEAIEFTEWEKDGNEWFCEPGTMKLYSTEEEVVYMAMVMGLREYVEKNNFNGVIVGLSGGIDSALTAAIAVDALGADKVTAVMMPTRFTSEESLVDAEKCAKKLGLEYHVIPIEDLFLNYETTLAPIFTGKARDTTEENLQSRIRGTILMALSNKFNRMVISTGNKSEMATGYATLYGDMCGGYSVLKDVYKTQVYKLTNWRNSNKTENAKGPDGQVIPQRIITRAPTAELRENQKDEDSLPPYEVLDLILYHLIEQDWPLEAIVREGYEKETVEKVIRLLYGAEYKRRQSPPGVKISVKPFSRDRRYPITNGYRGVN